MAGNPNFFYAMQGDAEIHVHGWDSAGWFWHDLTDAMPDGRETRATLRKLRKSPSAFHGKCGVSGSPVFDFQTTAYDLGDAGLALVHLDGAPCGPIGALAVIPARRRARLRSDFAFGLVAHLGFLSGLIHPDSEFAVHDYIEDRLKNEPPSTLVFTLECGRACPETSLALSSYLEKLSVAMLQWLCDNDAAVLDLSPAAQAQSHKAPQTLDRADPDQPVIRDYLV